MAIDDYKVTNAEVQAAHVQAAPNTLTGTAQENKAVFDGYPELLKEKHNNLIDAIDDALSEKADSSDVEAALAEKADIDDVDTALAGKVDKIEGKGLSANDYIDADKALVGTITNKVDKETGKGLSTNDYTTAEKMKLSGIEAGAEVNVQADWETNDTNSDAYIKNKPPVPSVDSTLSTSGAAADAKKVGDEITDLKSAINGNMDAVGGIVNADIATPKIVNGTYLNPSNTTNVHTLVTKASSNFVYGFTISKPLASGHYYKVARILIRSNGNHDYEGGYVKINGNVLEGLCNNTLVTGIVFNISEYDGSDNQVTLRNSDFIGYPCSVIVYKSGDYLLDQIDSIKKTAVGAATGQVQFNPDLFVNGGMYQGNLQPSVQYRVAMLNTIKIEYDVTLKAKAGFKFGVHSYESGVFDRDSGWQTNYTITANTEFKIVIARTTEDTSEIADIETFVNQIYYNTIVSEKAINVSETLDGTFNVGDFKIGGYYNGNYYDGNTYPYRVASPKHIVIEHDSWICPSKGFRFAFFTFAADGTVISDSGWKTTAVRVSAGQIIGVSITKVPEGTTTPTVSDYVNALTVIPERFTREVNKYPYTVNGDAIETKPTKYFMESTNIQPTSYSSLSAGAFQGLGYNNGVLFQFYSDDVVELLDFNTGSVIADLTVGTGHGNTIGFLNSYYSVSDEFPTAIVSDSQSSPVAYHVRITRSSATILKTIKFSAEQAGYYANVMVDALNDILYTVGYTENSYTDNTSGNNKMIFAKWDWSNLTVNGDSSVTPQFIESFTTPFMTTMQGPTFYNGKLYVVSSKASSSNADTKVYVVDPIGKRICSVLTNFVDNIKNIETENICFTEDGVALMKNGHPSHPYYKLEASN